MAAQLTQQDIDTMCNMVAGMKRPEAIRRLQDNNNNLEQALNEYFDNPGSTTYKWDESQFNSDRDGGANNAGISFQIHSSDDPGPPGYFSSAPSRPPSRISSKYPPSNVIDLTGEHALADPKSSMTHDEREFADIQKALVASTVMTGLPPQETGITGTNEMYFGPANRSQYEEGKWDIVPTGKTSAQEILLDPEPAERRRHLDTPAFLKPSIDDHRLGGLLTIYHEIPLARELFLDPGDTVSDYGYDSEWWTGKAIEMRSTSPEEEQNIDPEDEAIYRELQRLMAFLDKTDRSYGSAEVLANLRVVKKIRRRMIDGRPMDTESAFFEAWKKMYFDSAQPKKFFSRGVPSDEAEAEEGKDFAILDLGLPPQSSDMETFYDIADEALWPQSPLELSNSAYLSHISDVISFRLAGTEASKSIEIPAVWYPDRYLKFGREAALKMRQQQVDIQEELQKISLTENKLTLFNMRGSKVIKVQDLFQASLQHDAAPVTKDISMGQPSEDEDPEMMLVQRNGNNMDVSAELRKVMASINKKLRALDEEKEKARAILRQLSKLYTEPSTEPGQPPFHKYTLRGVSTTKSTTYVCKQAEPDLIDMDLDVDESVSKRDQWWRIHYATSGPNPITVEKTTQENVLEAALKESKTLILVYASEAAMQEPLKPLPYPLGTFVRADNLAFSAEFPSNDSQSQITSPKSPGKRKFDDSSDDSQDGDIWNGANQIRRGNSMKATEMELKGSDESEPDWGGVRAAAASQSKISGLEDRSITPRGNGFHDVIMGVDPTQLVDISMPNLIYVGNESGGQEMQELSSLRMLSSQAKGSTSRMSTIDSMDLDEVMEDADNREESAAVKHVGFTE